MKIMQANRDRKLGGLPFVIIIIYFFLHSFFLLGFFILFSRSCVRMSSQSAISSLTHRFVYESLIHTLSDFQFAPLEQTLSLSRIFFSFSFPLEAQNPRYSALYKNKYVNSGEISSYTFGLSEPFYSVKSLIKSFPKNETFFNHNIKLIFNNNFVIFLLIGENF